MEEWMVFPEWRRFLVGTRTQRSTELLEAIEKVAHQAVARELDPPREVITRLLHQLVQRGRITMTRGAITVGSLAP